MKKELVPYDYYYESVDQDQMMSSVVANGHMGLHPMHPFNMEDNFLQILGKNYIDLCRYSNVECKSRQNGEKPDSHKRIYF